MNMCAGGCIKGPTVDDEEFISRFKVKLDMEERICREPADRSQMEHAVEAVSFRKEFLDRSPKDPMPTEEQIRQILRMTNKFKPEDELNCGACGYPTCREKAIAVFQHKAEVSMCIPYMHEKAESMSNLVMETSPNIVLIVGPDMRILEYSDVGEKYFGKTRSEALEMYLYEFIDPVDFQWVFDTHQNIHGKRVSYPEYHLSTLQNIVYIEKENAVLATFIDITREEELAQEDYEKKLETIAFGKCPYGKRGGSTKRCDDKGFPGRRLSKAGRSTGCHFGSAGYTAGSIGSIRLQGGQLRNGRKAGRLCPSGEHPAQVSGLWEVAYGDNGRCCLQKPEQIQ